jgi:adenylate kinase family enzyme
MRTIIIGNSGSGKTWLAQRLAPVDCEVIHLDHLFWMPDGFDRKRSKEAVDELIAQSKTNHSWICEGVFGELAERYFECADTLIWLDMPWELCHSRLEHRGSESKAHLDRAQSEEGLRKLLEWASRYYERTDLRSHDGHQRLLNAFHGNRIHLQHPAQVATYVHTQQGAQPDAFGAG